MSILTAITHSTAASREVTHHRVAVMGVINVSPESFYAPLASLDAVIDHAAAEVAAGADILDVGGEATNPAVDLAAGPDEERELARVIPAIEALRARFDVALSVDTSRTAVMDEALQAGAHMINDQRALTAPGATAVVARHGAHACLMHFPVGRTPGESTPAALLAMIQADLTARVEACLAAGIARDHLMIDPGFGGGHYGKNTQENYFLLAHLAALHELNLPILVGLSRKSMIGDVIGKAPEHRLHGSVAAALFALSQRASVLRVHDVAATVEAVSVWRAAWAAQQQG